MQNSVSIHEQELFAFYGKDPANCKVTRPIPGKGVFVLFTNRCGSNLFVDILNQQPSLSLAHEVFNANTVRNFSQQNDLTSFDDYVHRLRGRTRKSCWGAKVGAVQLNMLYRFGLMSAFEEGSYIIWLKRKDIVSQAVSHFIADATRQWASFQETTAPTPAYDFKKIAGIFNAIINHNAQAETVLALTGLNFTGLWYEDFLAKPNFQLKRISVFLDEPCENVELGASQFQKQQNNAKQEYAERFLLEAQEKMGLDITPYAAGKPTLKHL